MHIQRQLLDTNPTSVWVKVEVHHSEFFISFVSGTSKTDFQHNSINETLK